MSDDNPGPGETGLLPPDDVEEPKPIPLGVRLFLIPAIIVAACGVILLIGRMLSTEPKSAAGYLDEIRSSGGNRRWQAAYELSTLLDREGMRVTPPVRDQMIRLFEEIEGRDPRVRRYLAICLGKIGDPAAVPAMIEALDDTDSDTQLYAVWALGAIGDPRGVAPLLPLAASPDGGLRTMVAYALGTLGTPEGLAELQRLLVDPAADVRWNAAAGLARHRDASGVEVIAQMLDRDALGELPDLTAAQQDEVILNGIRAVGMLGTRRLDAQLEELVTDDPSPNVRQAARSALAGR